MREVASLKTQAQLFDQVLEQRLDALLPQLMKREKTSMWIVMNREYNEDPVYLSLVPRMCRNARRLSTLVFYLDGDKVQRYCIGNDRDFDGMYTVVPWDPMTQDRFEILRETIERLNPENIALDYSLTNQFADGLTKALYDEFARHMTPEIMAKVFSGERIVTAWLETRNRNELARYRAVNELAKSIIEDAFSRKVITPGVTTTTDVEWFLMEEVSKLGLVCWFTPTIDVQRRGCPGGRISDEIILPGDVIHCDFGIQYMGLSTDTQRIAYVPREGETEIPPYLQKAYDTTLRFMDIVADQCVEGRTGNEILLGSMEQAQKEGIKAHLYTHPIGVHGHAAGPTIGLYYRPGCPVPGTGDYPLYRNTCYALELNTKVCIPEWDGEELWVMREETVAFTKDHQLDYLMTEPRTFKMVK